MVAAYAPEMEMFLIKVRHLGNLMQNWHEGDPTVDAQEPQPREAIHHTAY